MPGKLYLISTHIGNPDDISLRALKILKSADILVCEEMKIGRRLLAAYQINRDIRSLNEHNETEETEHLLGELEDNKDVALFSDAGTPLFADPGTDLVRRCIERSIPVTAVPGANALLPALQLSGIPLRSFVFAGWLSPKREIRITELDRLKAEPRPVVILEAPYRLIPLLRDVGKSFGPHRKAVIAFDLTTENETIYRDTTGNLYAEFERNPRKGEFVLILEGNRGGL